jgi:hypothetical protein
VESRLSAVEQTCEPPGATTGVEPASRSSAHRAHVARLHHVQRTGIRGVPQRWVAHYERRSRSDPEAVRVRPRGVSRSACRAAVRAAPADRAW